MVSNHVALRLGGVFAVVVVYGLFAMGEMSIHPMLAVITAIIALISPEVLDKLWFIPWAKGK